MQSLLLAIDPDLTWFEAFVRIGAAAGLGGIVGLERELDEKAAGLRTHMLVAVGSALFTMVALTVRRFPGYECRSDRAAAQVVTGIGFLGAA
jgi:putative Mg2+ transporter-C (MgtC) family protein